MFTSFNSTDMYVSKGSKVWFNHLITMLTDQIIML